MDCTRSTAIGPIGFLLAIYGCGGEGTLSPYSVTDSAGVEIVVNHQASWREGEEWTIDPEPSLTIGTVAGDPAYEMFIVLGATRRRDSSLVTLNAGTYELRFYDSRGQYIRSVGGEGEGPAEFRNPSALFRLGADSLVVWDLQLGRLSVFDGSGGFARSFAFPVSGNPYSASLLFGDRTMLAHTSTAYNPRSESGVRRDTLLYVRFSLEGDSLATIGRFPDAERFVLATGRRVSGVAMVFGRTTYHSAFGASFFVGRNDAYIVDEFDSEGFLRRSIRRDLASIEVTDAMFAREVETRHGRLPERFRASMAPVYDEMPKPPTLPFYSGLRFDPDGNMWVRVYSSESDPVFVWTVFEPSGRMLGDVTFPSALAVYEIGRDYVLGRWRDESDIEFIHVHDLIRR